MAHGTSCARLTTSAPSARADRTQNKRQHDCPDRSVDGQTRNVANKVNIEARQKPIASHFHFEGGVGSVFCAVAQQALAGVTRPYKPKEEPATYLGELLVRILEALHARPVVAKLVVLQLSSNPVLDPLLAERVLLALAALGVPTETRPKMFQRAMGVIFEMILAECGRSSAEDQKEASAQMHNTIASLSPTEFPNLTELREALVAETVQAGAAKPSPDVAAAYADRLAAALSVK